MQDPYREQKKKQHCNMCEQDKFVIEFSLCRGTATGLQHYCKPCSKKYRTVYRTTTSYKSRHNARTTLWQKNNPLKTTAHKKVRQAILTGDLIVQPCEKCGNPKTEAHHEDYTKPLDVVWLCSVHHKKRHVEINAEEFRRRQALTLKDVSPSKFNNTGIIKVIL